VATGAAIASSRKRRVLSLHYSMAPIKCAVFPLLKNRPELVEKARNLTAPVLGRAKSERLIETVYGIETVTDIRRLRPLLQRG
jgi:glycyl-tRNA synthetase (class II)